MVGFFFFFFALLPLKSHTNSYFFLQFQEHWIKQGLEGGKKAASALRTAISQQLVDLDDVADNVQIIAKVFANFAGLIKAVGQTDFKEFAVGFTQGSALFDFIDIGSAKERADSKIKGT